MHEPIYIAGAQRTAIGRFLGSLATTHPAKLSAALIRNILDQNPDLPPTAVDEVIMGQVLQAAMGQNPARQAALQAGLPKETPAMTINKVCGSGMKAVHLAAAAIWMGDANVVFAGGQENMSMAPHAIMNSRAGQRLGDWVIQDIILSDGLTCSICNHAHMGTTAENVARNYQITREAQDEFAVNSQRKAHNAQEAGRFRDEIVPVEVPNGKKGPIEFKDDEFIRHDASIDAIKALRPAFNPDGTVTAANASGINDGAAVLLVASEWAVKEYNLKPIARLVTFASAGVEPSVMGIGPVPATRKCLSKAKWTVEDLDLIESNEAFAAQSLAVNAEMGWDLERVNVNGGSIALGHPIGASGARILTTLIHEMGRRKANKGLATMCIGGGLGIATTIERV